MRDSQVEPSATGAFAGGVVSTVAVLLLFGAFLGLRVGYPRLLSRIRDTVLAATGPKAQRVLDLPAAVRTELAQAGAVVDNAGEELAAGLLSIDHDTVVVRRDPRFGWVQRPGVEFEGIVLRARNPLNLDPPVLYLPSGAPVGSAVARFLGDHARVRYRFATDSEGHRRTLPAVDAERAVLVVGDSVAFGVGVSDEATVASVLQRRVGPGLRVVNAGVGGYSGEQARAWADALSQPRRFDALVYLTSQNDFMLDEGRSYVEAADEVLAGMGRLRERFSNPIVMLVVSYLEFEARDLLLEEGWPPERVRKTEELYRALPDLARRHGISYVDWSAVVDAEARANGSIFATLALYSDHGHLSPHGSRIAAREIQAALESASAGSYAGFGPGLARTEPRYDPKRSAVGEPAAFSSSSITLPNGSRP
jgi:lysophospholipase L1-like esterase